jgi:hypothetical protein
VNVLRAFSREQEGNLSRAANGFLKKIYAPSVTNPAAVRIRKFLQGIPKTETKVRDGFRHDRQTAAPGQRRLSIQCESEILQPNTLASFERAGEVSGASNECGARICL